MSVGVGMALAWPWTLGWCWRWWSSSRTSLGWSDRRCWLAFFCYCFYFSFWRVCGRESNLKKLQQYEMPVTIVLIGLKYMQHTMAALEGRRSCLPMTVQRRAAAGGRRAKHGWLPHKQVPTQMLSVFHRTTSRILCLRL